MEVSATDLYRIIGNRPTKIVLSQATWDKTKPSPFDSNARCLFGSDPWHPSKCELCTVPVVLDETVTPGMAKIYIPYNPNAASIGKR